MDVEAADREASRRQAELEASLQPLHQMRILVHSINTAKDIVPTATTAGDLKLDWNPLDNDSVNAAKEAFNKAIAKGFRAFRMDAKGKQGLPVTAFDVTAERLLLIPQVVGG